MGSAAQQLGVPHFYGDYIKTLLTLPDGSKGYLARINVRQFGVSQFPALRDAALTRGPAAKPSRGTLIILFFQNLELNVQIFSVL